jgi:tetratricopeptide (TPR) repeat protein
VGSFEQALSTLPHLPETRDMHEQAIDLRLALRSALRPLGDYGRILVALREAESLASALNDPHRLGQILVSLTVHFYNRGEHTQAIQAGQRALALATASGDGVLRALMHLRLGQAYSRQDDYRRAIDYLGLAVAFFDAAGHRERFGLPNLPAVLSRAFLARCYAELGMFAEDRALCEAGLQIAEAVGHPGSLMHACYGSGLLALHQGDLPKALP